MTWTGSCLCGDVTFTAQKITRGPITCHCDECRKQSGHFYASFRVPNHALQIVGEEKLRWYAASAKLSRGFCPRCGCVLAMRFPGQDVTWMSAGAADNLDQPITQHVFAGEKGDYYQIDGDAPHYVGFSHADGGEDA